MSTLLKNPDLAPMQDAETRPARKVSPFSPPVISAPQSEHALVGQLTPSQAAERARQVFPVAFGGAGSLTVGAPVESFAEPAEEEEEGSQVRQRLQQELIESGELFSAAQLEEEVEARLTAQREEMEAAHQQQLDALEARHQQALMEGLERLQRWREMLTHQSTELLLRLSETLTLHLVRRELLHQPELYIDAVLPALEELVGFSHPRLYLPPAALDAVRQESQRLQERHPDHVPVEVLSDDRLEAGDFRLEADGAEIAGELEGRLGTLVEACRERASALWASRDVAARHGDTREE